MKRRDFIRMLALGGAVPPALTLLQACQQVSESSRKPLQETPRLVILYAPCTISKSFLSPYNPSITNTPHHERFADGAAVFTKHQTECGESGVAYASIFTGGQAHHHGIFRHPSTMDLKVPLITEAFVANGWDVHFFGRHHMASYKLNYAQGTPPEHSYNKYLTGNDQKFLEILFRLRNNPNLRVFILTNFTITHYPYMQNGDVRYEDHRETALAMAKAKGLAADEFERYRKIYMENTWNFVFKWQQTLERCGLKDEEIPAFVKSVETLYGVAMAIHDRLLGGVFETLEKSGLIDESLVVNTADHGEYMYNESELFHFAHGNQLSQASHAVPLIIKGAGVKPGRYDFVTRSIDVFPTIAGLCGLSIPEEMKPVGADLSAVITSGEKAPSLTAFSHTMLKLQGKDFSGTLYEKLLPTGGPEHMQVSVREDDMIYMIAKTDPAHPDSYQPVAYDLSADPLGCKNIFDASNKQHQAEMKRLREYKESLVSACHLWSANESSPEDVDEKLEALRQMGYIQ